MHTHAAIFSSTFQRMECLVIIVDLTKLPWQTNKNKIYIKNQINVKKPKSIRMRYNYSSFTIVFNIWDAIATAAENKASSERKPLLQIPVYSGGNNTRFHNVIGSFIIKGHMLWYLEDQWSDSLWNLECHQNVFSSSKCINISSLLFEQRPFW